MTTEAPGRSATAVGSPGVLGVSHLALTVADLPAAHEFWSQVMGFERLSEGEGFCMLIERAARVAVVLTDHPGSGIGPFSECRVGLDHLALAVADVATLEAWAVRLATLGVPHTPITTTDAGRHLNLRAPDNFPVELYVMSAGFAAAIRIDPTESPVARTH